MPIEPAIFSNYPGRVATAGALSMLVIAPCRLAAGGTAALARHAVAGPAIRAGSARATAVEPPLAAEKSGPDQRNRKVVREIQIDAAALKSPEETIDDLNARAKDAGESLSSLAKPSMMVTAAACPVAANGAPE